MGPQITQLVQHGGPLGIGLVVGLAMWWYERKETKLLQDKVVILATSQIEANTRHTYALEALSKMVDRITDKL